MTNVIGSLNSDTIQRCRTERVGSNEPGD